MKELFKGRQINWRGNKTQTHSNKYEDPMICSRRKMAVIDSISKAMNPAYREEPTQKGKRS